MNLKRGGIFLHRNETDAEDKAIPDRVAAHNLTLQIAVLVPISCNHGPDAVQLMLSLAPGRSEFYQFARAAPAAWLELLAIRIFCMRLSYVTFTAYRHRRYCPAQPVRFAAGFPLRAS